MRQIRRGATSTSAKLNIIAVITLIIPVPNTSMLNLLEYLAPKHPEISKRVVGRVESNLPAASEPEILALAREWLVKNRLT